VREGVGWTLNGEVDDNSALLCLSLLSSGKSGVLPAGAEKAVISCIGEGGSVPLVVFSDGNKNDRKVRHNTIGGTTCVRLPGLPGDDNGGEYVVCMLGGVCDADRVTAWNLKRLEGRKFGNEQDDKLCWAEDF